MNIPNENEVKVRNFLQKIGSGDLGLPVDESIIEEAGEHFKAMLRKQFNEPRNKDFTLRMSNLGRPNCQLWFQKNKAEEAESKPYDFIMKMLMGDAIEVISLAVMKAAGVNVESSSGKCSMDVGDKTIHGEYDVVIDGKVWDVKSASPYSFQNKFKDFDTVKQDDPFGYVSQGYGYAKATDKPFGGWIAINKVSGEWAFVEAREEPELIATVQEDMADTIQYIEGDKPFKRCFDDVEETYRKKPTGNRHLGFTCTYCDFKSSCWPELKFKPSTSSMAKTRPWKYYTVYNEPEEETDAN